MTKIIKLLGVSIVLMIIVTGCTVGVYTNKEAKTPTSKIISTNEATSVNEKTSFNEKEMTLYVGERIEIYDVTMYYFNGFIGEDTLAFEDVKPYREWTVKNYQPAKKGHTFVFKGLENYEFEVIDFSRAEGYVKLKVTGK